MVHLLCPQRCGHQPAAAQGVMGGRADEGDPDPARAGGALQHEQQLPQLPDAAEEGEAALHSLGDAGDQGPHIHGRRQSQDAQRRLHQLRALQHESSDRPPRPRPSAPRLRRLRAQRCHPEGVLRSQGDEQPGDVRAFAGAGAEGILGRRRGEGREGRGQEQGRGQGQVWDAEGGEEAADVPRAGEASLLGRRPHKDYGGGQPGPEGERQITAQQIEDSGDTEGTTGRAREAGDCHSCLRRYHWRGCNAEREFASEFGGENDARGERLFLRRQPSANARLSGRLEPALEPYVCHAQEDIGGGRRAVAPRA
mmetsp:Transcript_16208/g.63204  ORF Transcript_16208/g.63204 Transcript_16208/m.63204 type:complete len:310 (+) Transcript_16208:2282-3211(+)